MNAKDIYFSNAHQIHVIEMDYRRHRQSLLKARSSLAGLHDNRDKVHAVNRRRQLDNEFRQMELARSNDQLFGRLRSIEEGESLYAKERREHIRRVLPLVQHRRHVSRTVQESRRAQVHQENMFVYSRISRVTPQPEHVPQACERWYSFHERVKAHRRHRLTGGHLMTSVPKELRPASMQAHERSLQRRSNGGAEEDWTRSLLRASTASREGSSPLAAVDMFGLRRTYPEPAESVLARRFSEAQRPFSFEVSPERRELASRLKALDMASPVKTDEPSPPRRRGGFVRTSVSRIRAYREREPPEVPLTVHHAEVNDTPPEEDSHPRPVVSPKLKSKVENAAKTSLESGPLSSSPSKNLHEGLRMVLSWNFPLPHQHRNCTVELCVLERNHPDFLELVLLRMLSTSHPIRLLFEMRLSIDEAHEIASLIKYLPQAVDEGTSNIQAILHNMFYEHDTDRNGSLSYDELAAMLSRLGLGIGQEDMHKLIAEADLDDDGRVDFLEFVNIAASTFPVLREYLILCRYVANVPREIPCERMSQ